MIKARIQDIEARIQAACDRSGRKRAEVTLIAVSKTNPANLVEEAYHCGLRHFGENKVQEMCKKQEELTGHFKDDVSWHLIGHLQSNKIKQLLGKTVLIHSVDTFKLGQRINAEAAKLNMICDILVEVNVAEEETKFGVSVAHLTELLSQLSELPHIRLRGLMTIAPYVVDPEQNRVHFSKMHELFIDIQGKNNDNNLKDKIDHFNILSMGMTGDFEVAIEEGSTMVRVGTGIFGERTYTKSI